MKALRSAKKSRASRSGKGLRRRLFRARTVFLAALVLVVAGGVVLIPRFYRLSSPLFPVKEIVFQGNLHLSEGELKNIAGINGNEDLVTLSAKALSSQLLGSPWIKDVSVRKEFPNRILIRLAEASPFAILETKGHTFLIDDRGRMLEEMNGVVPFLPIINADPSRNRENFMEALSLAKVIKEKKIATERNRVEIIADKGPEAIALVLDNVVIKVGQGDYERKLNRLFALEDEIKKRAIPVDYVDLRFANRVVVKPISEVVR
jgi:cell division protein FtsQ